MDKFPRPYTSTVPKAPDQQPMMEYVKFDRLGIGARTSGLPKEVAGINNLDHVGNDATSGKK